MARKPKAQITSAAAPAEQVPVSAPATEAGTEQIGAAQAAPVDDVAQTQPTGATGFVIVTALQPVRRRAGRLFTPEPVRIPMAELSDEQLLALAGDPLLKVEALAGGDA